MDRLTGQNVSVHLKSGEILSGLLFDAEEKHVYLQNDVNIVITIPRENIKYYISELVAQQQQQTYHSEPAQRQVAGVPVRVFVDDVFIGEVGIPENIGIMTCTEALIQRVYDDANVKEALRDKIQKDLTYDVGRVDISTYSDRTSVHNPQSPKINNSFGMGGGTAPSALPIDIIKNMSGGKTQ